jgi:putative ABC transport system permease protein
VSRLRQFLRRVAAYFRRTRLESEMAEEMRLHLEHLTERSLAAGLAPEEARQVARRRFGGSDQIKEQCRDAMGWRWMNELGRDLGFSLRFFRQHFGFSVVAVATIALCVGANTAIFSVVYPLLMRPLPYPEPGRIVEIYNRFNGNKGPSNLVQYDDYKRNAGSYGAVGLWELSSATVGSGDSLVRVTTARCTAEIFDVFGMRPVIGQFFTLRQDRLGEDRVVVLTESFWEARFHRDPGVLGQTLRVDGLDLSIVGVAPRAMETLDARVLFMRPIGWKPDWIRPEDRYYLTTQLFARLKPEVSVARARDEAAAIERRYYAAQTAAMKKILDEAGYSIEVGGLQAEQVRDLRSTLWLLQCGAAFVLLVGCVNVANLLLLRANYRHGELALRLALGASPGALARQLVVESLALTLAGAAVGTGLAWAAVRVINQFSGEILPNLPPFEIDSGLLGFTAGAAVVLGSLISLVPSAHVLRANLAELLPRASRSASNSRSVLRLSSVLAVAQVAAACLLLVGTGLLVRSYAKARAVDPGFDARDVFVGRLALPGAYSDAGRAVGFQKRLFDALKEAPGISEVAFADSVPFEGKAGGRIFTLKEGAASSESARPETNEVYVSPDYFKALHIRLLEGRLLREGDQDGRVYVVDERFAKRFFPGRSAVGGHFTFANRHLPAKDADWPVIVGVVRRVPYYGAEDSAPYSYGPLEAAYMQWFSTERGGLNLFVHSLRPGSDLLPIVREALRGADPAVPLFHAGRLQATIDQSYDRRRGVMLALGGFSILATFLSALGIYGVLAYDVAERTREIGIRGALGATRAQIVSLFMRQGLVKALCGWAIGLAAAVFLGRYMEGLLFGLKPVDPWAYLLASLLLGLVAALASGLPARRAARINPIDALRSE